jgi:UDP-glucose 4-epimerase
MSTQQSFSENPEHPENPVDTTIQDNPFEAHTDPKEASFGPSDVGIDQIQADLERFRDLALRSQADFENYRKRSIREREEAVRTSGHSTRTVFSSTGGALYGDFDPPPSTETFSKDPEAPYGIAKLSVEYYLAYYGRVHGLDTVALRYGNVYGPRQDPHGEAGVVAIFCNRLLDGRALTVFGDGEQTRDYVYAGDVARANFLAATSELPARGRLDARAFNVGTSLETSVNTLAETLRTVSGATAPIEYAPARAGELARSALETSKARAVLGWEPQVALSEGLANTYRFFADRRARLAAEAKA